MSDTWASDAERFNKFHAPAGSAAGGQFAAASGSSSKAAKGKDTRPTPTSQHPVGQGETGKRVSDLQERLNAGGFKPPLKVDGIFGPKTLAAVKAFQKAHGLKVDGLVGPLTTAALRGGHPAAQHTPAHTTAHAARVAGQVTNPGGTEKLHEYWVRGEGAAKIRWGSPGDFDRCVLHLGKFIADPKGYCAKAHHDALGIWPATHAAMEHKAGRADMAKQDVMDKPAPAASRAEPVYFRTYELEDIHIVRTAQGDSTGRLVEAYATAFNAPAEIMDFEGHYIEEIDPAAFNKVLADIGRSRAGFGKVKVMYNHGMTIHGTPSERGSMPIATPVDIRPEARGLLTLARYSDTPFADEVLENIRNGSITAQSFTGRIVRSDPQLRRGGKHYPRDGQLPRVRRMELGLKEFGPTPFEAYSGAEILGVRMSTPGAFGDPEPDENEDEALPPDGEAAAGEPPQPDGDEHSARYHQHALYRMTSEEMRKKAGLVW
jgi:HK97 family phage prohead protease